MEGYPDTIIPPNDWVRALYDYESDDRTSLSFRSGDVVQVLTRLDSGWWDGVINGQRGWFPSNYCEVLSPRTSRRLDHAFNNGTLATAAHTDVDLANGEDDRLHGLPDSSAWNQEALNDEGIFWIPQCMGDGTLYYFNTCNGQTSMELPLQSSSAVPGPESGEDVPGNLSAGTSKTRDVSEIDSDDGGPDEQSGSETEDVSQSQSSPRRKRDSYMSDGASPATSLESLSNASPSKASGRRTSKSSSATGKSRRPGSSIIGAAMDPELSGVPVRFLDYGTAVPITWDDLLSDVKASIERYKRAVEHDERSSYVKRAEDISDHVRLVLAAGSGTTDNHSGNPSIITKNKALYPRFRDMMSRFAKLVLDSHINAADYSPPDYGSKCLHDADGVMEGVYGYIEVARQQKGEEVPRLFPGFLGDRHVGGNWNNNGLISQTAANSSSDQFNDDYDSRSEPNRYLDTQVIAQMDGQRSEIELGLRRLANRLVLKEKLISYPRHRRLTREVCAACQEVFELYCPWMAHLESITLAPLGSRFQMPQITEFTEAKQRVYNSVADLVMSCQAVGAPLADEWAQDRGLPLEDRLERVKAVLVDLDAATSRVNASLQHLHEIMPAQPQRGHKQNSSVGSRSAQNATGAAVSFSDAYPNEGMIANANNTKLQKMLGLMPTVSSPSRDSMTSMEREDVPQFLKPEFESEILFNNKTDPPSVQGGSLTGLLEQLTRHDVYNPGFMNTFLYTYQSFTTGQELFERLVQRWSVQPLPGLSEEEYSLWEDKLQRPVRFRVYNVLKNWVEFYWMEENDVNEQQLLSQIYNFGRDTIGSSNLSSNRALLAVLDARLKGEEPHSRRTVASYMEGPAPKLPKNMKKFKFTDIDPTEFARQLTIIQQRLYCQIKPSECLTRTWGSKILPLKDVDDQKGIRDNIRHANQVTNYMAETILNQSDLKKRVAAYRNVINIADACLQMSNFATLTAVLSSLGMSAIVRMNRTYNMLDRKTKERLEFLRVVMATEKNYGAYREALRNASQPSLPFLGITLQDMRFVEDGMTNAIPGTTLINFHKRTALADQVRLLMSYQNITYPFKSSAELQSYINDRVAQAGNIDLYEMSLKAEPREREDEKIARLLSESGFL